MEKQKEQLTGAIGAAGSKYIEEVLETRPLRQRAARLRRLSAACIALAAVALCSATALAVKYWVPSWKDVFGTGQTVVGEDDQKQPQSTVTGDLDLQIGSILSDERVLYLTFTLQSPDGQALSPAGSFRELRLDFPDKLMSGAYRYYFPAQDESAAPGQLGGILCADWQADSSVKTAVLRVSDWLEPAYTNAVKVDVNLADMLAKGGEAVELPGSSGVYLDSLSWEDGLLQVVLRGPCVEEEWLFGGVSALPLFADEEIWNRTKHWYFADSRSGEILFVEVFQYGAGPETVQNDPSLSGSDWQYAWSFLEIAKEDLPYLELYCGGTKSNQVKWTGSRELTLELPVTMASEVLAEDIPISFGGEALQIDRIECSKISIAVYFPGYVDSTTGILSAFEAFDRDGQPINCHWSFTAEQSGAACMVWASFDQPLEPGTVCTVTFNGVPIYSR